MAWKTGRSRTLTFTGSFTADDCASYGQAFPVSAGTFYQWSMTIGDVTISIYKNSGVPTAPGPAITEIGVHDTQIGSQTVMWPPLYSPPPLVAHAFTLSGTWAIHIDVEEWADTYVPSNVSTVNGTDFPAFGGAAEGDGLPAIGVQFYELTKIGGTKSFSVTYAGVTAAQSGTMSTAISVGYGPTYNGWFALEPGGSTMPPSTWAFTKGMSYTDSMGSGVPGSSWSYTAATADFTSGGNMTCSVSNTTVSQAYVQFSYTWTPAGYYDLDARLRSWGQPFHGSINLVIEDYNLHTATIALNPAGHYGPWQQVDYVYTFDVNTNGHTGSQSQSSPVSAYLNGTGSDDTRDWRCMISGFQWDAISLSRSSTHNLDPCSALTHWTAGSNTALAISGGIQATVNGGAGGATLGIISANQVWEAYRLLGVTASFTAAPYNNATAYSTGDICLSGGTVYQAVTSTTGHAPPNVTYWNPITELPVVGSAGGATWDFNIPSSSARIDLELPCGTTDTATIGLVQSRFPIQYPGGFPINEPPVTQYSFGWGVNYASSVTFSSIPNGAIVTFTDVSLVSETSIPQSAVTLLENFLNFINGWTSPTDNTTVQPFMFIEADGKVIDMPAMCLVTPSSGMTPPTYTFYTIAQARTLLAYFPGITATLLTTPTDGYHGDSLYMLTLGGNGATYDWTAHQWTDWVDVSLPKNIPSQDLWDEIVVYPGAGNVWKQSGAYGGPTPIQISKSLRGQATGLTYTVPGVAAPGYPVSLYETAHPTISEGTAVSDSIGKYYTGTPYAYGNVDSTVDLEIPTDLTWHSVIQNRQRLRTSFRHSAPVPSTAICALSRPVGWGYVVYGDDAHLYMNRYVNAFDQTFTMVSEHADDVSGCWIEGANPGMYVFYVDHGSGNVYSIFSNGFEDTWGTPTLIATGTEVASYYAPEIDMTMAVVFSSGTWTAYTSIGSTGTWVAAGSPVSSVSDTKGALNYESGAVSQWRFSVPSGTSINTYVSQDGGQTWVAQ